MDIRAAHLGLFGIVLSIKLKVVPKFYIEETRIPYKQVNEMKVELTDALQKEDYVSLIGFPAYNDTPDLPQWEIRIWKKLLEEPENLQRKVEKETLNAKHEAEVFVAASDIAMRLVTEAPAITPLITRFASGKKIALTRKTSLAEERLCTHYEYAFPFELQDFSILFPVRDNEFDLPVQALEEIELALNNFAHHGKYPVTYAVYLRFFKGTRGGLSSSDFTYHEAFRDGQYHVCALELLTHPNAEHFNEARNKLIDIVSNTLQRGQAYRFHLGKDWPEEQSYLTIYPNEQIKAFYNTLRRFYNIEERVSNEQLLSYLQNELSFVNEYFIRMFSGQPLPKPVKTIPVPQKEEGKAEFEDMCQDSARRNKVKRDNPEINLTETDAKCFLEECYSKKEQALILL